MALDLGTLVGYLETDNARWNKGIDDALRSVDEFGDKAKPKALAAGRKAGDAFGDGMVPEAEKAGEEAGEAAGEGLKATGAVAAGAAGLVFGMAFTEALDIDAGTDKLAAQLGATARQSRQYGQIAGNLYSGAWGESMDEVRTAIGAVDTSIDSLQKVGGRRLQQLTGRALDFATAFEIDVVRGAQVAGVVIESGLAKNGLKAFDLLTKGAQEVGPALQEDLLDAVEEYGQFFASLGYTGPEAFGLLVDAAEKGTYGIDKAGDAVKEFTILSTDMSTASKDAYKMIGLDARDMADMVLAGGDDAQKATQKIIDGLLGIESPSKRAEAAIALFGTPLEDLNVRDIPDFLRSLKGTEDGLKGVEGASKRMSDTLNDNASTKVTAFKRKLETQFVGYFADEVIPLLEDDVIPALTKFGDWLEEDGGPALRDFVDDVKPAVEAVGDLAGFLNDLPGEAKLAGLAALLGGGVALKMKPGGLFGNDRGSVRNPAYVVVTNPGGLPGGNGPDGKPGKISPKSLALGFVRGLGLPAVAGAGTDITRRVLSGSMGDETASQIQTGASTPGGGGFGSPFSSDYFAEDGGGKQAEKTLDRLTAKAEGFRGVLDLVGSTKVHPDLAVPRLPRARRDLQEFLALEIAAGRPITPYVALSGYERAMSQIETLKANIHTIPTAGLDNGVPFVSGGGSSAGATGPFAGATVNVTAHDYKDFTRQTQRRAQESSLGGRPE